MHATHSSSFEKILALTESEATRRGHAYVGTEHFILALVSLDSPRFRTIADACSLRLADLSNEVLKLIGRATATASQPPLPKSPRLDRALAYAEQLAEKGQEDMAVQHVLLGILQDPDTVAIYALRNAGADIPMLSHALLSHPVTAP